MDFPGDLEPQLPDPGDGPRPTEPKTQPDPAVRLPAPDLGGLSIAGITRRRVAWTLAAIVSIWIIGVFARQVADVAAASDRAQHSRVQNVGLASEVSDLKRELALVQRQAFVEQEARAYGLGASGERPFALAADAPPLAEDAPGSAAVRLGARPVRTAPLDVWLDLLFGPSD